MEQVKIYDSTLRDGAQGYMISFSVEDKLLIAKKLDDYGVHYIEAGYPSSSPKDAEFFRRARALGLKRAKLVAFGSTRRAGVSAEEDAGLRELLDAGTEYTAVYGKAWDFHVKDVIQTTLEENLDMISSSISYLVKNGRKVIFDAEHFFDGYKNNPEYAARVVDAAWSAGAFSICLCDTNGGAFMDDAYAAVAETVGRFGSDIEWGIHCHNDSGLAAANTVKAYMAGCSQIQGTFTGIGERCGNANLSTVIPLLELKLGVRTGSASGDLSALTRTAAYIADVANSALENRMPFVGKNAFRHKGGAHLDGVLKSPESFEHIDPALVGNKRRTALSEQTGRAGIIEYIQRVIPGVSKQDDGVTELLQALKDMENRGYQYEAAEASFELFIAKSLKKYSPNFEITDIKITTNTPFDDERSVTAVVRIISQGKRVLVADEGVGPVNALDKAVRKSLEQVFPQLRQVRLIDFKVRVLDNRVGTEKLVRVVITSSDGARNWSTVGISANIIEASFHALLDSLEYKLMIDAQD